MTSITSPAAGFLQTLLWRAEVSRFHPGSANGPGGVPPTRVVGAFYGNKMRLVVIIVAALMILGVAALGLILAQKGSAPTAMVATVHIASATQEVSALPARAPVTQIAQATGFET